MSVTYNNVKYHVNQYKVRNFDIGEPPVKKSRKDYKISENDRDIIRDTFKEDPYSTSTDIKRTLMNHVQT